MWRPDIFEHHHHNGAVPLRFYTLFRIPVEPFVWDSVAKSTRWPIRETRCNFAMSMISSTGHSLTTTHSPEYTSPQRKLVHYHRAHVTIVEHSPLRSSSYC
ncbi:hypothetical protein L209DRAFT_758646 [Thermothelomyces heterothallicus CBS 203.75]